ncbi:MAG: hypothetical protein CL565_00960 [Alphaproteobacteria bacterium]|nr:hypothetical protein [Alphaproteobacteria bacterium]|tara:strand:- start:462 stop:656 length:195 start_codon:yes stop_codon:yes gene_type:complete
MGLFSGAPSAGATASVAFGGGSSSSVTFDADAIADAVNELGQVEELTIAAADREYEEKRNAPQP